MTRSPWLERVLLLAAALLLGRWASNAWEAHAFQVSALRALDSGTRLPRGEVVGRIIVPRLGIEAAIAEGVDPVTLKRAVGHVPGTALPGDDGNVALAGHRDTFLARLANVRLGDRIRVETPDRAYEYVVESRAVVEPQAVGVIAPTRRRVLTLVTCFPFHVLGPAPDRFVVRARFDHSAPLGAEATTTSNTSGASRR